MSEAESSAIAVIGGGPGGLMAAEILSAAGRPVTVYDHMPSLGRKLLMAGRGGLNLTHSEDFGTFVSRYGAAAAWLRPMLDAFPPDALRRWAEGLGEPTFIGSSGRVFPKSLKASPLLRTWLGRLARQGVQFRPRHEWQGWDDTGALIFQDSVGARIAVKAQATILALGGASWPRLGSNGRWAPYLAARGVAVAPFRPANCGFLVEWTAPFRARFEGAPLKRIALRFGPDTVQGEALITRTGIEGGAVYALSAMLRDAIAATGPAVVELDLRPGVPHAVLAEKLGAGLRGQSLSNLLRKAVKLPPVAINLLREAHGVRLPTDSRALACCIKAVPLTLTAPQALAWAISSAGGIAFSALDDGLMLRALPGVYAVGEMLDWEAPTGGYLLQATLATARAAAQALLAKP